LLRINFLQRVVLNPETGIGLECNDLCGRCLMPVYDYVCKACKKSFELVLTLSEHDKKNIKCPKCGSKKVEQEVAAFYAVTSKKS
jgi:putative FmdB family regulatory protein